MTAVAVQSYSVFLQNHLLGDEQHALRNKFITHADKAAYLPEASLVWAPRPGLALFVGGSRAADDMEVLSSLDIRAKACLAGTYSRRGGWLSSSTGPIHLYSVDPSLSWT